MGESASQATQELIARVPETKLSELNAAVDSAAAAFEKWSAVPVTNRVRRMHKLLELIHDHKATLHSCRHPVDSSRCFQEELAQVITQENGKTIVDSHGDIFRGTGSGNHLV